MVWQDADEVVNPGRFSLSTSRLFPTRSVIVLGSTRQSAKDWVLKLCSPEQFRGLGILSIIVWMLDLILFIAILAGFSAKWICFPASSYREFSTNPGAVAEDLTVRKASLIRPPSSHLGSSRHLHRSQNSPST